MRRMSFLTSKNLDMTEGNLYKKLWIFTIPLIFAGLLQLLYNACDLVVCGRFGSEHSVGAIGATNSIINLILNFFIGLSIGTNVLMSRAYGSKDDERGKRIAYTSMILSVVLGIAVTIIGVIISPYFLEWMGTPDEQIDLSTDYLQIYFLGSIFTLIYNFGASLLRATGDSRKPFIFLATAGVLNVVLNLLLVIGFNLDVKGVAIATVASQAFSAILIVIALLKSTGFLTFNLKEIRFYSTEAKQIFIIGGATGIQSIIFSLSNILIQSSVNSLGAEVVDGNSASQSLEGFIYQAMNQSAQGGLAFISANYGAQNYKNIKKCILYALSNILVVWGIVAGLIMIFHSPLIKLYVSSGDKPHYAWERLFIISITYFLCGFMDLMAYSLRGIGYSVLPTIISLIGACGLRIVYIFTLFRLDYFHNIRWLSATYPISWIITMSVHIAFLIPLFRKKENAYNISIENEKTAAL